MVVVTFAPNAPTQDDGQVTDITGDPALHDALDRAARGGGHSGMGYYMGRPLIDMPRWTSVVGVAYDVQYKLEQVGISAAVIVDPGPEPFVLPPVTPGTIY